MSRRTSTFQAPAHDQRRSGDGPWIVQGAPGRPIFANIGNRPAVELEMDIDNRLVDPASEGYDAVIGSEAGEVMAAMPRL